MSNDLVMAGAWAQTPRLPGQRRQHGHLPWCGSRCRAGACMLGEHRSDPITAIAGPVGGASVIGTRVAQPNGRQHLELRINIPLDGTSEQQRARAANHAIQAITTALLHQPTPTGRKRP